MNGDPLEIKVRTKLNSSIIHELLDDASWLRIYCQFSSSDDLPEAQRCRRKFEQMDLSTRYMIYKELREEASRAIGRGNPEAAKIYMSQASYLWKNYIVVSRT